MPQLRGHLNSIQRRAAREVIYVGLDTGGPALLVPGGPGQFGIFHYGLILGLSMFVSEAEIHAAGSVFIFWMFVTQLGVGLLLGLASQRLLALDWRATLLLSELRWFRRLPLAREWHSHLR